MLKTSFVQACYLEIHLNSKNSSQYRCFHRNLWLNFTLERNKYYNVATEITLEHFYYGNWSEFAKWLSLLFLLRFNFEICPIFFSTTWREGLILLHEGEASGDRLGIAALRARVERSHSLEEQGGRDTNSGNKRNKQRNTRELCHSYSWMQVSSEAEGIFASRADVRRGKVGNNRNWRSTTSAEWLGNNTTLQRLPRPTSG